MAALPGFAGYIIASCDFPQARGLSKIFSPGKLGISQDAQVITTPRSTSTPQRMLFPFVTNQNGFDTGVVISNTSADPLGTTATSGTCTVNFYGANSPSPVTTGTLTAGSVTSFVVSSVAPNFSGYIIISCNFTGAAGFAFISDTGAQSLMMSVSPEMLAASRGSTNSPLLFTSLKNVNGLDTGLAISNTTSDPQGTTHASGTCTINFYGTNAPAPVVTSSIASGSTFVTLISAIAPGFDGYAYVTCQFPHARGWRFTGPVGLVGESEGSSAEVVTTPRNTTTTPLLFSAASGWNGADTQITIHNTTADTSGTTSAAGTCTLTYFGDSLGTSPSPQTSSSIAAGSSLTFSLSQGNTGKGIAATPGFHGYIIADCGFPLARGMASISGTRGGPPFSAQPDFNGDGHQDILWQDPVTGLAQVWYLGGAQGTTLLGATNLTRSNSWRVVGLADFNGDGHPDAVWQDPESGSTQVWYLGGADGNAFLGAVGLSGPNSWRIMSVADFNGDGKPDVIWQDPVTGLAQIWLLGGQQGITLLSAVNLTSSNSWKIVGTGDFNLDGYPDVVWQDPATGTAQVWYLGGASGNVVMSAVNMTGATTWRIAGVGDYNNDGRPDLIWQDPASGVSQMWFLGGVEGTTTLSSAVISGPNTWRIQGPR